MSDTPLTGYSSLGGPPQLYRHSGKVSPTSLAIAALILIPLGILMGGLYSAAVVYLPFVKLRGLVTFFFGAILGAIAGSLCYKLKYRNKIFVILTILGFTSIAYYSCWAVHPALVVGADELQGGFVPALIQGFDPRVIIGWATMIFNEGIWAMGNGGALKGWGVVAVWALEFGMIYVMAIITGVGAFGNRPFCEDCQRWNEETEDLAVLPVSTSDQAWEQIRGGNFDALKKLQIADEQDGTYVELRLADCPGCDESDYLSAIGITLTMNDGELKKNESDIFRHLSITRQQREEIVAFAEAMAAAVEEMNAEAAEAAAAEYASEEGAEGTADPSQDGEGESGR